MSDVKGRASAFVDRVRAGLDGGFVAAVLYGSAARGEYREGASDLNLLVLVSELGARELSAVAGPTRDWVADGNPPPLLMTESEWRRSADVFPIEYSDIRDAHLLLAGRDPFEGIRIDRNYLRLQLEHELRSKKIQLREGFLVAGNSAEELGSLLVRSLSTFLALFRGMLRLTGDAVPASTPDLVRAVGARAGFPPESVLRVYEAKRAANPGEGKLESGAAEAYLAAVEHAVRWLDGYRPPEGAPTHV